MDADMALEQENRKYGVEKLRFDVQREKEKVIQETNLKAATTTTTGSTTPHGRDTTPTIKLATQVNDYLFGTHSVIATELFLALPNHWDLGGRFRPQHQECPIQGPDDPR